MKNWFKNVFSPEMWGTDNGDGTVNVKKEDADNFTNHVIPIGWHFVEVVGVFIVGVVAGVAITTNKE